MQIVQFYVPPPGWLLARRPHARKTTIIFIVSDDLAIRVASPKPFALITLRFQYCLPGRLDEPVSSRSKGSTTLRMPPCIRTLPSLQG